MPIIPEAQDQVNQKAGHKALEIGARLLESPSQYMVNSAFKAELDAQMPLFDAISRVDLAHSIVLAEAGIIPIPEAQALLQSLAALRQYPADFKPDPEIGDLYTNREAWLTQHSPASAWLGAGRARREAITTAYSIKVRTELLQLSAALQQLVSSICKRSGQYSSALMPDYTYLMQAQPSTFGHYLLSFAFPVLRDLHRIEELYARLNKSPAGCGSSNGSRIPQSRARLAKLLGFDGIILHGRDAMWQADIQIELVAILSSVLVNIDRLAEDLQIFSTEEFALVTLDDSHARASKIMPQKKNPFALTYLRALANSMIGHLSTTVASARTPSAQPDNRLLLYGSIPEAIVDTHNAVLLLDEVILLMTFNHQHAQNKLQHGFALASDLLESLVLQCGVPFRDAHRVVGTLVRNNLQHNNFHKLSCEDIARCAESVLGQGIHIPAEILKTSLQPELVIAAKTQPGSVAPQCIAEMIQHCQQALNETQQWSQACFSLEQDAELHLQQAMQTVLNNASNGAS